MKTFTLVTLMICVSAEARAAAPRLAPGQETGFAIPRMSRAPEIDGVIDPVEWRESVAVSGLVNTHTDLLIPRPTTFFVAWDPEHLYFACRTYLKPGYKFRVKEGRSEGNAYCYDDGLELLFKPMGRNVSPQHQKTEFRMFLNCLGFSGDLTRLALGQQMKNWDPHFQVAVRTTEPGTAPGGGSWWEMEVATSPEDFELTGNHRVGDRWKLMFGFNHVPIWMQARIPCVGSYFTADGKCLGTLVENTPAVQVTMDKLANLASDGTASLAVKAYNPAAQAAKLSIEVNVADAVTRHETLTVPAGGEARFELNQKLPAGLTEGLAHLAVTQGDTTLLTYTALFKVGEYDRMMRPIQPPDPNDFAFAARFNPVRGQLLVKADSYYLPDSAQARALNYTVTPEGTNRPIAEGEITRVAEWYFQDIVPLVNLRPGKYTVEATLELADGSRLGPMSRTIEKKDEAKAFPAWWGKNFGNVERVLPPFTPIEKASKAGPAAFSCWGRTYALNAAGLPAAVRSQDAPVLTAPARIVVVTDGQEQTIPLGPANITGMKDWRVSFEGKAEGAGLVLESKGWLEQDGLVYVELTYRPSGSEPVRIDALRIEYPLAEDEAECLVCVGPGSNFSSKSTILLPRDKTGRLWSTLDTGRTGSNMKVGSFYPAVWIGNERRGFLWWADHDRGWVPDDAVPAHEAVRTGGAVVLRNNIIGTPFELDEARTISFSFMASPFKPLPQGWRMIAATDDGTFFQPFRGVRTDSKTGEKLWNPGRGNINWIHPESRYPEEWSALWAEQKEKADAWVRARRPFDLYAARSGINFHHMSFQLIGYGAKSIEKDVYAYFGDEWFPGGRDTWNETYTDYAMYLFDRAFREGGVVSAYWDLTFPILFDNLLSGLSYRLPDDRVQPGYNGWNVRRFFMRLWALAYDHGLTPGAIGSHSTNAYVFVALPWLDAVLDGERDWHLDTSELDWIDYYPVERMRTMSSPHNWGVGLCWMSNYTSKNKTKILAAKTSQAEYLWMHDSWLNPYLHPARHMTAMPEPILDWGLNGRDVVYHPYWRNPYATCADPDVLVSLWQIPAEKRILVGVFNYNKRAAKDVRIKLDLAKLELSHQSPVVRDLYGDWVTSYIGTVRRPDQAEMFGAVYRGMGRATRLSAADGVLRIESLKPHRGTFVGLGVVDPAGVRRLAATLPEWIGGEPPSDVVDFGMARRDTKYLAPGRVTAVTCEDPAVRLAAWQLPDRLLLSVANTDEQPRKDVALHVDLEKLNLLPELPWQEFLGVRDFVRGEKDAPAKMDSDSRTLTLKTLQPNSGRLIGIRRY